MDGEQVGDTRTWWLGVVQRGEEPADDETELVTLNGVDAQPGGTIELTNGQRITLLERVENPSERVG